MFAVQRKLSRLAVAGLCCVVFALVFAFFAIGSEGSAFAAKPKPSKSAEPATRPVALFIGDSFTVGVGSPNLKAGFAYQLASHYHWRIENYAVGRTGYLAGDQPGGGLVGAYCFTDRGCPNYSAQVDQAVAAGVQPQIIIVSGGYNDTASPEMAAATVQLFQKLHTLFPSARVYVTSPITTDVVTPDLAARIEIVRDACAQTATTFLDLGQPLAGKKFLRNHIHPNAKGHTVLARAIADLIDRLGSRNP